MSKSKTLLISLPWADYISPSPPIGYLASFARKHGYDVEARHEHLAAAVHFGLEDYDRIACNYCSNPSEVQDMHTPYCGEAISASLVMPDLRQNLLNFAAQRIPLARRYAGRIRRILLNIFKATPWSRYSLIGFTTNHEQIFNSVLMARWIKRAYPDIRIVFGGGALSGQVGTDLLKKYPQIDWCIQGEGECAFLSLLDGLQSNFPEFEKGVPGLLYRHNGSIHLNSSVQLDSLKGYPDPDYDHYYSVLHDSARCGERYIMNSCPIELSRGCMHRCSFCFASSFKGYRKRRPREVADSVKRMSSKYKTDSITLLALTVPPSYSKAIFPRIAKHRCDYRIYFEFRAEMTRDRLAEMKRAGVCRVQVGLEGFNSALLNTMRKGVRVIENLQSMKFCEELGFDTLSNIIIGFPTETKRDIQESCDTIDYALAYKPPTRLLKYELREGSPMYKAPSRYKLKDIQMVEIIKASIPRDLLLLLNNYYYSYAQEDPYKKYRVLLNKLKDWKRLYEHSRMAGRPLLVYYDYRTYLIVEDYRQPRNPTILKGWKRKLYLYCNAIKSYQDIRNKFPECKARDIREALRELVSMKLMYREGEAYLSLALRSSGTSRPHMPFLEEKKVDGFLQTVNC